MSHDQLVALGMAPRRIGRAIASGRLTPLLRGVYAVGHASVGPRGRAIAALRAAGPDAVLSHASAAALWRIAPQPPGAVHVTVARRPPRSRPGLLAVHSTRRLDPRDVRRRNGLRVTAPARTLLDLAAGPGDTAAPPRLTRAIHPGRAAPTRSALERAMLRIVDAARLPRPVVNRRLGRFRPDFLWPDERVVVETDGFAAHGHRTAFERDRARDAELAALGYVVLRFTWRQLTEQPVLVSARLAQVLLRRAPRG